MTDDNTPIKAHIEAARGGDRKALEAVVVHIQDQVHRLAMRMLVNPEDALDATQEILVLVVTRLSSFEGRSAFSTWVYRIAVNHILDIKRAEARRGGLTFEMFRQDLEDGLADPDARTAEDEVMLNELRIACTMAMLLCLDLDQRVAYVLGDIFGLGHTEASEILEIAPTAYRKRLSRARGAVVAFTSKSCGLANAKAPCSCPRRLPAALAAGRVDPDRRVYSGRGAPGYRDVASKVSQVEGDLKTLVLQRATPGFECPINLGEEIARVVDVPA